MRAADELLRAVQRAGLPITGFTMRDPNDVNTWTFYGRNVTRQDVTTAIQIIQALIAQPVARTMDEQVSGILTDLAALQQRVAALEARPVPASAPGG